jgi:ADP-ribose pyrophosphatase
MREPAFTIHRRRHCHDGFLKLDAFEVSYRSYAGATIGPRSREVLVRGHAVAVLPYDARRDRLILTEQFRMPAAAADPARAWVIEPIAGLMAEGEQAEDVARREAVEEAGLNLGALEPICAYFPTPGSSSEFVHLFAAPIDEADPTGVFGLAEEGEDIRVLYPTAQEAFAWLDEGRCDTALTIIAVQWLRLNRARLREDWSDQTR